MYILNTTTKSNTIPPNFTGIVEYADGSKQWLVNGKVHRLDGPAYVGSTGRKCWYIDDNKFTEAEHKIYVKNLNNKPSTYNGKQIEIDGKKYKLILVD